MRYLFALALLIPACGASSGGLDESLLTGSWCRVGTPGKQRILTFLRDHSLSIAEYAPGQRPAFPVANVYYKVDGQAFWILPSRNAERGQRVAVSSLTSDNMIAEATYRKITPSEAARVDFVCPAS